MRKTAKNNPVKTDTATNRKLILKFLGNRELTANEIIDRIFKSDIRSGRIEERTWKFYVHLNKLFSPLEYDGVIEVVDTVTGPTNRPEKVWKAL